MQNEQDELLKQSNKKHKKLREKLKKKRDNEKKTKKEKKEKKKKAKSKDHKKKKHKHKGKDDDEDEEKSLRRHVKKLMKLVGDEIDDFVVILETIDEGTKVDIEGLEKEDVKKRLKKLFKCLKLRKNEITNEYYKDPEIHTYSIQKKIEKLVEELEEEESSSSEGENEGEDVKRKSELEPEVAKKQIKQTDAEKLEELHAKLQKINEMSLTLQGLDKSNPAQAAEPKEKDWKNFLDDKFSNVLGDEGEGYSKLGDKKKKKGQAQPKSEEEKVRTEVIQEFMEKYNETFRDKSLLEIHKEKKAQEKKTKGIAPTTRRPFDREKDLSAGRIDSKKLYEVLNDKKHSLNSRFGNSNLEKSFL